MTHNFQMIYIVTRDAGLSKTEVVGAFDALDIAEAMVGCDPDYTVTKMPLLCCDNVIVVRGSGFVRASG